MSSSWQQFFVTTEPPSAGNPEGAVAYGSYAVAGDNIRVRNDRGKLVGTAELVPCDDPEVIARRILRRGRAQSDFNRPLPAARVPY